MRSSELLASVLVDEAGRRVGPIRDVRVGRTSREGFRVTGLVAGMGRFAGLAHAWGFAEGRAAGPWLLRVLTADASRRARFVPAERIVDWGPGEVRIDCSFDDLPPLGEALGR